MGTDCLVCCSIPVVLLTLKTKLNEMCGTHEAGLSGSRKVRNGTEYARDYLRIDGAGTPRVGELNKGSEKGKLDTALALCATRQGSCNINVRRLPFRSVPPPVPPPPHLTSRPLSDHLRTTNNPTLKEEFIITTVLVLPCVAIPRVIDFFGYDVCITGGDTGSFGQAAGLNLVCTCTIPIFGCAISISVREINGGAHSQSRKGGSVVLQTPTERGGVVVNFQARIWENLGSNTGQAFLIFVFHSFPKSLLENAGTPMVDSSLISASLMTITVDETAVNERAEETENPRENPLTCGTVRQDSHMRKSRDEAALSTNSQCDSRAEHLPRRRHRGANPRPSDFKSATLPLSYEGRAYKSPYLQAHFLLSRRRRLVVVTETAVVHDVAASTTASSRPVGWLQTRQLFRLLASHLGLASSIPGGYAPGLPQVGIVPDDTTGLWVFSGISCFLRPFIPALLHAHLASLSSHLKTSTLDQRCQSVRFPARNARIFARGNSAGRCCLPAGFLGALPLPRRCIPAPLHPRMLFHVLSGDEGVCRLALGALPTGIQRRDGNTAHLARRSDEALEVRVVVARIAPSLLGGRQLDGNVPSLTGAQDTRQEREQIDDVVKEHQLHNVSARARVVLLVIHRHR
ncbi:hypothetical protein PR048_019719 [Dryococelus australis]|uniref:Uncharacterized protein n=1 Tax=Dryococelus australis TaxID=614101 RepID=A0ABQ9H4L8_9NEOP|nr:hypothetical protein PR048_019719 [Dryococelus australis]